MSRGEICGAGMGQSTGANGSSVSGGGFGGVNWQRDWGFEPWGIVRIGGGKRKKQCQRKCTTGRRPSVIIEGLDEEKEEKQRIRQEEAVKRARSLGIVPGPDPVIENIRETIIQEIVEKAPLFASVGIQVNPRLMNRGVQAGDEGKVGLENVGVQACINLVDKGVGFVDWDHSVVPENYSITREAILEMNAYISGLAKSELEQSGESLEAHICTFKGWMNRIDEEHLIAKGLVIEEEYLALEEQLMELMQKTQVKHWLC
jgi:hypothetical protein